MPLFNIIKGKTQKVNQKSFKDEMELHKLIDNNLDEIFNIRYIRDEHITNKHGRIETLGLDETNRPVVIEYKKTMEKGQLVQANRYITWVKQNPDSFELLVRNNIRGFQGKIDFANPRIICFAQDYSIDDKCLALSLNAELWKYRYYDNSMLYILREEEPEQLVKASGKKTFTIEKVRKEPTQRKTIEELLKGASKELVSAFEQFEQRTLGISSEIERITSTREVIYKTSFNFVYLTVQKRFNRLRIYLRTIEDEMNDPKKLTEGVPENYGNITRVLYILPNEVGSSYSWDDVLELVIQAYNTTQ